MLECNNVQSSAGAEAGADSGPRSLPWVSPAQEDSEGERGAGAQGQEGGGVARAQQAQGLWAGQGLAGRSKEASRQAGCVMALHSHFERLEERDGRGEEAGGRSGEGCTWGAVHAAGLPLGRQQGPVPRRPPEGHKVGPGCCPQGSGQPSRSSREAATLLAWDSGPPGPGGAERLVSR